MIEEVCELAGTGTGQYGLFVVAGILILMAIILISRKGNLISMVFALVIGLLVFGTNDTFAANTACVDKSGGSSIVTPINPDDNSPSGSSPITGLSSQVIDDSCGALLVDTFTLDLMDGTHFTTTGPGALLPSTIDLDPSTPGRQTSITISEESDNSYYISFTVNDDGLLSMVQPTSPGVPGKSLEFSLDIIIQDSEGYTSSLASLSYLHDRNMCE